MLDPHLQSILDQHRAGKQAILTAWHRQHQADLEARRAARQRRCGAKTRTGAPCLRRGTGRGGRCPSHCGSTHGGGHSRL